MMQSVTIDEKWKRKKERRKKKKKKKMGGLEEGGGWKGGRKILPEIDQGIVNI